MVREIRTHPADIIHIHWPNPTAVAAYFASRHRGRLVMTYHSDVVRQKTLARVIRPLLTAALKRADAVIVTSRRYAETSSVLRSFIHKCRVIPFGLDSALYEAFDRARAGHIRAEYGPRLLLAVGRHVYYKGFEYLIAAMRDVRGKVLMAGDGPLRSRLAALTARHGVDDRVVFLGEVDDLVPYYHAADAVVLPSITRNEAFGIVQMEAMACGRPVINTALDSTVPLVSLHGKTGLTVTPKNVEELASAMNLLLDDERLRLQYGTAARRRVETEFTAERMTSRTLDLYRQIIGGTKTQHAVDNFAACI
jgi:rhamnosyl/mannosyltransferase